MKTGATSALTIVRRQSGFAALVLGDSIKGLGTAETLDSAVQAIPLVNRVSINPGTAKMKFLPFAPSAIRSDGESRRTSPPVFPPCARGTRFQCNRSTPPTPGLRGEPEAFDIAPASGALR